MSKSVKTPAPALRKWSKPRLSRLGTIADVAGTGFGGAQGGNKT